MRRQVSLNEATGDSLGRWFVQASCDAQWMTPKKNRSAIFFWRKFFSWRVGSGDGCDVSATVDTSKRAVTRNGRRQKKSLRDFFGVKKTLTCGKRRQLWRLLFPKDKTLKKRLNLGINCIRN